jgi:hypothetical protein
MNMKWKEKYKPCFQVTYSVKGRKVSVERGHKCESSLRPARHVDREGSTRTALGPAPL